MTKSLEISYQFFEATETSSPQTSGCSSCHIVILEAYLLFSGVSVILIVISDSWRLVPLDLYRHSASHSCCHLQFLHLKSDSQWLNWVLALFHQAHLYSWIWKDSHSYPASNSLSLSFQGIGRPSSAWTHDLVDGHRNHLLHRLWSEPWLRSCCFSAPCGRSCRFRTPVLPWFGFPDLGIGHFPGS